MGFPMGLLRVFVIADQISLNRNLNTKFHSSIGPAQKFVFSSPFYKLYP